ncbi:MAG: hypothetical protein FWD59_01310 [Micrococcales bacterium]|nr:hypothetical protein [Micrococcales bacterium]
MTPPHPSYHRRPAFTATRILALGAALAATGALGMWFASADSAKDPTLTAPPVPSATSPLPSSPAIPAPPPTTLTSFAATTPAPPPASPPPLSSSSSTKSPSPPAPQDQALSPAETACNAVQALWEADFNGDVKTEADAISQAEPFLTGELTRRLRVQAREPSDYWDEIAAGKARATAGCLVEEELAATPTTWQGLLFVAVKVRMEDGSSSMVSFEVQATATATQLPAPSPRWLISQIGPLQAVEEEND